MPHRTLMIHKVRCCFLPVQLGVTIHTNVPGLTDSRGTLSQRSDNANDTDGEHLTRENCKSSVTIISWGP